VIHGPNLNLLGEREIEIYGDKTLEEINKEIIAEGKKLGVIVTCKQSNHEGQLIDWLHEARNLADFVVINPGGYTHTSVALADALAQIPAVEVHISNLHSREGFRRRSFIAPRAIGRIEGLGWSGYLLAVRYAAAYLKGEL